ncbi:VOC family protein [Streptomyces sp. 5-10]|uniref:VOC family protein n=1 Tax=Streptomyces sp. 5-10 TaxID=878925 RepID=UPI00168A9AB8|nr:VOC family protein [Streptomyces sp. 5-10]MBD3006385.1 VOC family protein [Streptomyces sp. 5-10]
MSALKQLGTVVFDCADPAALAAFYQKATGWEITHSDQDFASLGGGTPVQLAFVRVDGYEAPSWPEDLKYMHLDFTVADLDAAAGALLDLGASRPDFQPGEGQWIVLTDPEGHPFCLTAAPTGD